MKNDPVFEKRLRSFRRLPGDEMLRELRERGWRQFRRNIWQAPWGELFRGPAHAWEIATGGK